MPSAAHCGRHQAYRCSDCAQHHKHDYHGDYTRGELLARISELEAENEALREALQYVHGDLKLRAVDGVVAVGNGCWFKINKALEGSSDENT